MSEVAGSGKVASEPVTDPFGRADWPGVAHFLGDHLTALTNALAVARLAAGEDPRVSAALDQADRQVSDLADGLRDQG